MAGDPRENFSGALLGTFVGDALGMPVEGCSPAAIAQDFGPVREMLDARLGLGSYTDDTQMTIAVAESLVRCQGFDGADMAQAFLDNFDPRRGYGAGTTQVLKLLEQGADWRTVGQQVFDGGSYGNGAAMRMAPIGLLYSDDATSLKDVAYRCSQITHAHLLGKESAALQALAVSLALNSRPVATLNPTAFLDEIKAAVVAEASELIINLEKVQTFLMAKPSIDSVVKFLGNDVRAYVSVPAAIYAFLANFASFEEAVVFAVSLGGDTDTIGAMTGAIAGAFHGVASIPERWTANLENGPKGKDYIVELAGNLYDLKQALS
ncbi:ADP-ribosylglycohydrolase family protein [bacterium]|nr:ADP-ribosylglycohydrolase family protein [bacterium]